MDTILSWLIFAMYGLLFAIPPAALIWIISEFLAGFPQTGGMFAGRWTAKYKSTDGNEFTEKIFLKSRFSRVWGYSDCSWNEVNDNRKPMTVRYTIRGLQRGFQLSGTYVPAVRGEHDIGAFIIRLLPGSNAVGIITNYNTETGRPPDWHDLKVCRYEWERG
jgi:hypothetical protein